LDQGEQRKNTPPATPEEAAGGVFFLCSPWSNYVHGQTLHITGGIFGGMTG
jgi:3-oxoacyl-[acyl-carrier protein] reductase